MTLDEITVIDKELLAARYEAAITEEFGALAKFLDTTIEAMIARSRAASRVIGQMHEIAPEYDFEMELFDLIRRALTNASDDPYLTTLVLRSFTKLKTQSGGGRRINDRLIYCFGSVISWQW
jgi:hypothetical protein